MCPQKEVSFSAPGLEILVGREKANKYNTAVSWYGGPVLVLAAVCWNNTSGMQLSNRSEIMWKEKC